MEKTKMANFNENVNRVIGYILNSQEFFIYRTRTINEFARMIHDDLNYPEIPDSWGELFEILE